ncbi:carbohydrate ABC transporter permease [Solihabitans fulvus]|uniref:Carbohydrate ABC transporter permease n=1 Tax=Solihabitans fulvus TaxID=1892852 RepID=A0A5B2XCF8_9PSEU|nr:carbohydrate ABC transporter permease [Solihabitans fulvus]KAA2260679.1 carbohydrate ABC transporter permease [Solihabitans fulvus]
MTTISKIPVGASGRTASRTARGGSARPSRGTGGPLARLAGTVLVIGFVVPFLFALSTSLRSPEDVAEHPLALPFHPTLSNFSRAISAMQYPRSVLNTVVVTGGSCVLVVVLGAMAGYALGLTTLGWSRWAYRGFMLGMGVPLFVFVAPLYLLMRDLHLLGTTIGVILIYAAMNLPVAVFFYTSFVRTIPGELGEAAQLDGAGRLRTFFAIYLPLLGPVTATLLVFVTLMVWNDLMIPLIFLQDPDQRTLMVNAYSLLDERIVRPTDLFPAALLGMAPLFVLFVLFQRRMVEGMSGGGVKG